MILSICLATLCASQCCSVPVVDISGDRSRQTVIAAGTPEIYQGHPTTLLADDGKTIFCVWTTGHGGPCGKMARSDDGGLTWTRLDDRLPAVYGRTHRNCPVLQKVVGPDGKMRYCVFSAKAKEGKGMGILMSEDMGETWKEIPCASHLSSGMPPTGFMRLKDGTCALFGQVHTDRTVKTDKPADDQDVWMSVSKDGGFTWGEMRVVAHADKRNLCEPCCLRSPDGSTLALIMRENRHCGCSMMCFSSDEGRTWTKPVDTAWALTGDRHEAILLPDGRYVIAFRDQARGSRQLGQYLAWVGTWDDIVNARPGQYRIHLLKHYPDERKWSYFDTGYSGIELLPDGTIVCTTYMKESDDDRKHSVVSTRFKIGETDRMAGVYRTRVPEPKPVRADPEISAIYYPGTPDRAEWDLMDRTFPQTKPLLGWYDESNPEVIDWQIKWAVEHGVSSVGVDWYWDRGERRLGHWLDAYYRATWRKYLKWYIMYANHNPPGAHSTADQETVTRYWIDNYFTTPEYWKIDGKPVVVYFKWKNLDDDFRAEAERNGGKLGFCEGAKRALDITEKMVKAAGFPGVHFICMAWTPSETKHIRKCGFAEMMTYDYFKRSLVKDFLPADHPRKKTIDASPRYEFGDIVDSAPGYWKACWEAASPLPFWPGLSTGWDERSRTMEMNMAHYAAGRTVAEFRRHCEDAKRFCRENGVKRVILGPVNEWQEGNYVEPNEEFGFGMYDVLRDVFCEKPADGWPKNVAPSDVGCAADAYEFPPITLPGRTAWDFEDGPQGWYRCPYGAQEIKAVDGKLKFFRTQSAKSPVAIRCYHQPFAAEKFGCLRLRMKLTANLAWGKIGSPKGDERVRLIWAREGHPITLNRGGDLDYDLSAQTSVPAKIDGEWHEYRMDLHGDPNWNGIVTELYLDASRLQFVDAEIDWMRFEAK